MESATETGPVMWSPRADARSSTQLGAIAGALRETLSPRHSPDAVAAVPGIPRTLTGKKLELPVKRILLGAPAQEVASRDALSNPESIDAFVAYAAARG